jgi:G3E family GTPase
VGETRAAATDAPVAHRVPVTILAGFLGSGKTTLLNRILEGSHGLKVAVLVNDFGSINVDSRLVVRRDATMIELDNGCVCCSISADLVSQLTGLLEGPSCPEQVLVETSGVSDPGRLLLALRDPHFRRLARVDGVITLVDAAGFDEIPPTAHELARRQLVNADLIVFNKTDLVTSEALAALRERLTYPRARVVEARFGSVPLELVLGLDAAATDSHGADVDAGPATEQDHGFATWAWTSMRPLAAESVRAVLGTLPTSVYRAKGFLDLAEAPGQRVVAHVVGRRVDMRPAGSWGDAPPRSELVFISLESELETVELRRRLTDAAASLDETRVGDRRVPA